MHNPHPDIHEHGLQDGCVACYEHAEKPTSNLDTEMLSNLVLLTLEMRSGESNARPRTETEAIARANVMNILEQAGKIMEAMLHVGELDELVYYYRHYWRIPLG